MLLPILGLLLASSLAPTPPVESPAAQDSLQEFLRRARTERAKVLDALRPRVLAAIERMQELGASPSASDLESARAELRSGGPDSVPLLVAHLKAGDDAEKDAVHRAREVALALRDLGIGEVTVELVSLAREADRGTRVLALRLLAVAPVDPKIDMFLEDQARTASGPLKHAALGAVVERGTRGADAIVDAALAAGDGLALATIFEALEGAEPARADGVLRRALSETTHVDTWIVAALDRCTELPQPLSSEVLEGLGALAADESRATATRLAVLDALAKLEMPTDKRFKKQLADIAESTDDPLRNAALVCLALGGDRGAKRDLMRDFNELVNSNPNWSKAYEERGTMLLHIGEYSDASKDFKTAIDLDRSNRTGVSAATRINLARAFAGASKMRNAHEALVEAVLTRSKLAVLAKEPIFSELVRHSRYGKLFRGE